MHISSGFRKSVLRRTGLPVILLLCGSLLLRRHHTSDRTTDNSDPSTGIKTRVIVASWFVAHFDVYLPLVKDLQDVLSYSDGQHYPDALRLYAQPPTFGFQKIADNLGLFSGFRYNWDSLPEAMSSGSLHGASGEGSAEILVLGTCIFDIPEYTKDLLPIWDARPANEKFMIVCFGHGSDNVGGWKEHLDPWVRRRSIRILVISEHVADDYRRLFRSLADSADVATFSAGYEYIRVDVYVPLLDLPDPVRPSRREREKKGLSQVVIQGYMQMQSDRRNYEGVLKDLGASLKDDPRAWGYLPLDSSPSAVYKPDPTSALDPFVLHLAGSGSIDVPPALRDIVRLHVDLEYEDYYDLIHSMDLCIPAFAEDSYYAARASSTFVMAVQCNLPLLVSNRTREAYVYASDPQIVVIRPQGLSEIAAVKALRTGERTTSSSLNTANTHSAPDDFFDPELAAGAKKMQDSGWIRLDKGFKAVKKDVWRRNREVVRDILGMH